MKILMLLLHDERFSGWTLEDKLTRQHFSIQYMRFCRQKGWEPLLYTFHQKVKVKKVYRLNDAGMLKIFPVKFRLPPFLRFGNDHNPQLIEQEASEDMPDLVHFHHYYLFSFPYTAVFVKEKLRRPLTVQLHGYNNSFWRKSLYLSSLLTLRKADRIIYSYKPEESLYRKLGVTKRIVRIPVPGVDQKIFRCRKKSESNHLLYVGRIPKPGKAYGEKSPFILLHLLRNLLRKKDVVLDVVGDGPGLPHCQQLAHSLQLQNHISFHGYVPQTELPKYYQDAALTFSPIQVYDVDGWFDGAVQESLACGTPPVAFRMSSDTPLRGTYGFMLSTNAEKAAEEVSLILETPEDAAQMAEEGSRFVHQNCTYARLAEKLRETWEDTVRA